MKALAVDQGEIQWLVTGYMLVIGIVLPLSSLLTKWLSTRQLVIFGICAFIIGFLIAFVGALMLALVSNHSAIWYVITAHIILMIGASLAIVFTISFLLA